MRKRVYVIVEQLLSWIINNLYVKPKAILSMLYSPTKIFGVNYYPDMKEKSKFQILWEQCMNIFKYGTIDEYYYLYGLNVKNFRRNEAYLVYMTFSRRRDELNLNSRHNSSSILRNKLYFGVFAKAFGIETPENIALVRNGEVLFLDNGLHGSLEQLVTTRRGVFFCKPMDGECGKGVFKRKQKF